MSVEENANSFMRFVDASPSPYHVVRECGLLLEAAGFERLKIEDVGCVKPMGKYYVVNQQTTIMAFAVGRDYKPGNGFTMFGAHTDSPCLRVKVVSKREKEGFVQVGTECYGGGAWITWFDRDLQLAGRVIERCEDDNIRSKLIHLNRPLMRVPHLAIHLQRDMNDKFNVNKETHLVPILAQILKKQFCSKAPSSCASKHHCELINLVLEEAEISNPDNLLDIDLCLADHQPSTLGGANNEFINAPRIDNLHSTYTGLQAIIGSCASEDQLHDGNIRMFMSFDHEEVGSQSNTGAESKFLENLLRQLSYSASTPNAFEVAMNKSMMLSADCAHAVHPNYSEKHEGNMKPSLVGGPVLKTNHNNRYATTAVTATIVREIARLADVPLQDVMVRNDSTCGTTIGPIMAAKLGVKTADIGAPQLAMHSIREMCGTVSVEQCMQLYRAYFEMYPVVNSKMQVD